MRMKDSQERLHGLSEKAVGNSGCKAMLRRKKWRQAQLKEQFVSKEALLLFCIQSVIYRCHLVICLLVFFVVAKVRGKSPS